MISISFDSINIKEPTSKCRRKIMTRRLQECAMSCLIWVEFARSPKQKVWRKETRYLLKDVGLWARQEHLLPLLMVMLRWFQWLLVSTMDSGMELICQFHPCKFSIMVPGMLCIQNCQVANSALSLVARLLMQLNGMPPYICLLLLLRFVCQLNSARALVKLWKIS
jgi:hypothetical protein